MCIRDRDYYKQGLAKAIGLSNFRVSHLKEIMADATVMPAVDQIEFNPGMQDYETINFCKEHNIAVEAWSPLGGGIDVYKRQAFPRQGQRGRGV